MAHPCGQETRSVQPKPSTGHASAWPCHRTELQPTRARPTAVSRFTGYEPGFIDIDIKYLPQMPDESARRYLFVAIDRATRWVFIPIYRDQSEASAKDFLRRLVQIGRAHV